MPVELTTASPRVLLRALDPSDAAELWALVQKSRAHLTRHGDFLELADRDVAATARELEGSAEHAFGIFLDGALVGSAALVPVDPPRYGCGFWLAEPATGQGVASAAVGALVEYAGRELAASDVFAGVTHGNSRSVAVLERSGFRRSDHFDTYDRFHRRLAE